MYLIIYYDNMNKQEIYTIYIFNNNNECFDNEFGTPKELLRYIEEEPSRFNSSIAYDLEDSSGCVLEYFTTKNVLIQKLNILNK